MDGVHLAKWVAQSEGSGWGGVASAAIGRGHYTKFSRREAYLNMKGSCKKKVGVLVVYLAGEAACLR